MKDKQSLKEWGVLDWTTPKSMLSKLKQNGECCRCFMRVCARVCGCACVDFFRFVLKSLERSREKKKRAKGKS